MFSLWGLSTSVDGDWFQPEWSARKKATHSPFVYQTENEINKEKDEKSECTCYFWCYLCHLNLFQIPLPAHTHTHTSSIFSLWVCAVKYAELQAPHGCGWARNRTAESSFQQSKGAWNSFSMQHSAFLSLPSSVWSLCCSVFSFMMLPFHFTLFLYPSRINQRLPECSPQPFNYSW